MEAKVIKKVNSRLDASTGSQKLVPKESGATVNIVGMKYGENYRGKAIWYLDDQNIHYTSHAISLNLQANRLSSAVNFPDVWELAMKKALKIGVYDSGVTIANSLFGQRVVQLNHDNSMITDHHADYMASIIAGGDVENGYVGFLPNATIFSYQSVKGSNGEALIKLDDLKVALRQFIDNQVDLINISMRTNEENDAFQNDTELTDLLEDCEKNGIIVNCCVGNDFGKSDVFFCYPARLGQVFSIAGVYAIDLPAPVLYFRTNLWAGINLLAPVDAVYSKDFFTNLNIVDTEGTSVATAVTTGVMGLFKIQALSVVPTISFQPFLKQAIGKMPDFSISADLQRFVNSSSFKLLDLSTLNKTLLS